MHQPHEGGMEQKDGDGQSLVSLWAVLSTPSLFFFPSSFLLFSCFLLLLKLGS